MNASDFIQTQEMYAYMYVCMYVYVKQQVGVHDEVGVGIPALAFVTWTNGYRLEIVFISIVQILFVT